jgi:large conductance mechanosensitive channel
MLREFREFISRGNVMDMAVGIIIGAAFTAIVTSIVEDLINPFISLFTGGIDFSRLGFRLGEGEDAAIFAYGNFVTAVIEFLIIAWAVFLLVMGVNRIKPAAEGLALREADEEAPAGPSEKDILIEIRDTLKARSV